MKVVSPKGKQLWEEAKNLIPGGNQLLSKRSELFLPDQWPSYYKKAKGCEIWDLDNNKFFDFAGMGVTACILGYADDYVDGKVKNAIENGSMSTLNSYEEVALTRKLIEIHPWAQMARFARTGGEACAIAARIGRAASGKDEIAFCGYHGWHDWYLAANIADRSNLSGQLLPGLDTRGVPNNLVNTAHPFYYNDIESFYKVFEKNKTNIGCVMMEPIRGTKPEDQFLQKIRQFCDENNIILIFDEVTSGFHNNLGGIHLELGIDPDIVIFAKAMANGYPLSAILGKKSVMDFAQDTFISSTMWTERIGFTAGCAALERMESLSVQEKLVQYGLKIKNGWEQIACDLKIEISVTGLDSIPYFSFNHKDQKIILTYFNQEMLYRGFLTNAGTATSYSYSENIINKYLENVYDVFKKIKKLDFNVKNYLNGPIKHSTFSRLTD